MKPFWSPGGAPGGTGAGATGPGSRAEIWGSSRWARVPSAQPRHGPGLLGLLLLAQLQPRVF